MATVDGVVTAPDVHGIVQGNGGASDLLAGGAGNDRLEGHAAFNQYYGGAGNDTFIISAYQAASAGAHTGQSTAYADQFAYVSDFQGAGGWSSTSNDFIALVGFDSSSLKLEHTGISGNSGATVFYYSVVSLVDGSTINFEINSLNGKALGAGDFAFY